MSITIGPLHIADVNGTHEPDAVINEPSEALIALADAHTCDPATGLPYAFHTPVTAEPEATPEPAVEPAPEPEPAPAPEPVVESIPEPTPPAEEAA